MKKLKALGAISFALIGGGVLASIPLAMTSCGNLTDLSKIKFNNNLGTLALTDIGDAEVVSDSIISNFEYMNSDLNLKWDHLNFSLSGGLYDSSDASADSLDLTLSPKDGNKDKYYRGSQDINLVASWMWMSQLNGRLDVTGYDGRLQFSVPPGHKFAGGTFRPGIYTQDEPAATWDETTYSTAHVDYKLIKNDGLINRFKEDGSFQIVNASLSVAGKTGSFEVVAYLINDTNDTVVGYNHFFFSYTY